MNCWVEYGGTVIDHLNGWQRCSVSFTRLNKAFLYTFGDPSPDNPLALVSNYGPSLYMRRSASTECKVNDRHVTFTDVTLELSVSTVGGKGSVTLFEDKELYTVYVRFSDERAKNGWITLELS